MRIALRMNNHELILSTMTTCSDVLHKKQLAFLLARHGVLLTYEEEEQDAMEEASQVNTPHGDTFGFKRSAHLVLASCLCLICKMDQVHTSRKHKPCIVSELNYLWCMTAHSIVCIACRSCLCCNSE